MMRMRRPALGLSAWPASVSARYVAGRMLSRSLVLVVLLAATGCAGAGRREARALVTAVDRYRHADGASRAGQAQAVAAVACSDAHVCEAKRACLGAIDPTTRALALKDEVARRVGDLEQRRLSPDSADAQALPGKLDEAEKLLNEGRSKMTDCDRRLADLQIEFGA
jgi:hypothetical protein